MTNSYDVIIMPKIYTSTEAQLVFLALPAKPVGKQQSKDS